MVRRYDENGAMDLSHEYLYSYDRSGNRIADRSDKSSSSYEINSNNELVLQENGRDSLRYGYDADGNVTSSGRLSFVRDGENRIIEVRKMGTFVAKYDYDYRGRRVAKRTSTNDESYLYQGWNLTCVYSQGSPKPVEMYTWGKDVRGGIQSTGGVGGLLFANIDGESRHYHYDGTGNVIATTDANGNVVESYEYDPFGNILNPDPNDSNRFYFSTKPFDWETGLYYYGFRHYDPSIGRWLSRDPFGERGGLNLYAFGFNDPINSFDQFGLAIETF